MKLNKGFYKGISLFIKWTILISSVLFIYLKLNKHDLGFIVEKINTENNLILFACCGILMFVNWGIEAIKWKKLVRTLEPISFIQSYKSIFAGITVSIFTPNRIGEFAGKIFYLKKADKIQSTTLSFVGSVSQLFITLFLGFVALTIISFYNFDLRNTLSFKNIFYLFVSTASVIYIIYLGINKNTNRYYLKIKDAILSVHKKTIILLLIFSAIRYFVFSVQYFLLLQMFDINADIIITFSLISLVFFVSSAIPTFAFTEIVVRGASAIYFFSFISNNSTAIVASSLLLWIINIAIPALIGCFFIWELKFFKS